MRTTASTQAADKLPGLEALRFLAAFAVLIWHYQHFSYLGGAPVDLVKSELPFYWLLWPFYEAGEHGVWVFWCISGFIFFWKYRDPIAGRVLGGWTFFVFRLSRLYPLHVATLLMVAALQPVYFHLHGFFFVYEHNDIAHFLPQLLMASDWGLSRSDSFNGPIWSISVEVLVYAIFFVSLRFATKSPLWNVIIIVIAVNVSAQVCSCLAFFYAGGLAAIARQAIAPSRRRGIVETSAWGVTITVPLAIWVFGLQPHIIGWVFLLAYLPVLLFCLSRRMTLSPRWQGIVEAAGNMTYSSYLLHFPIQLLIVSALAIAQRPVPFENGWFFAAFTGGTLAASYFTYRYFEAPAQALIRGYLLSRRSRPLGEMQPRA